MISRAVDKVIIREVQSTYADIPVRPKDVLLDLGANIGAASRLLLDKGVASVVAVEPDPSNVLLARRNLAPYHATVIWAAVGAAAGRTKVYTSRRKPYLTSLWPDAGRAAVAVPVAAFATLLADHRPTIVKCDIEFGEYDLDWTLPDFVRVVALEVHIRFDLVFSSRHQTDEELRAKRHEAADLIAVLEAQGFARIAWREKQATTRPVEDDTGLRPLTKSVDAIWAR